MTPEELLRLYPRETLRWLRGRLGLSQLAFAVSLRVSVSALGSWEERRVAISPRYRARLAALLAPYLATPAGEAFARSLTAGDAGAGTA